jgi:hypothetical protein
VGRGGINLGTYLRGKKNTLHLTHRYFVNNVPAIISLLMILRIAPGSGGAPSDYNETRVFVSFNRVYIDK